MTRPLNGEETADLLASDTVARLATIDASGYPHVTPLWFLWADGAFHLTARHPGQPAHRLGPPPDIATLRDQVQALQQENLNLRRHAEGREEELAAAREANRRLMTELNHHR
jgi:nitroimidazol reductase NimA-like FMN-containing flavoprotein (pyridoxamine 5'-phosphate oxidase superfamily)